MRAFRPEWLPSRSAEGFATAERVVIVAVATLLALGAFVLVRNFFFGPDIAALEGQAEQTYSTGQALIASGGAVPTGVVSQGSEVAMLPIGTVEARFPMLLVGGAYAEMLCVEVFEGESSYRYDVSGFADGRCADVGPDRDGDGYGDLFESLTGADLASAASSPWSDDDGDGYANIVEYRANTSPQVKSDVPPASGLDGDGDGFSDVEEVRVGADAAGSRSTPGDVDGDGVFDGAAALTSVPVQ